MNRGQLLQLLIACGVLSLSACATEVEGSAISSLRRDGGSGSGSRATVDDESSDELTGAAGMSGAMAEDEPRQPSTDGVIYGVHDETLTGSVLPAAGTTLSGVVALYCCRAGNYDVYAYEDGRCSDPDSWLVEKSARVANVSCTNDTGEAPYVRDPAASSTFAFVIYDAAGNAAACADVVAE
jgi:hypothetical protein